MQRFQVALLGGVSLEHSAYTDVGTITDSTRTPIYTSYNLSNSYTEYVLRYGTSLRYHLGQHLDATLDVLGGKALGNDRQYRTSASAALGLRYRFGYR